MSATLFALVVLQGSSLTFSPGYQSAQECQAVYQGPNVTCYAYDPSGTTWTAFFRLPDGEFKAFGRMRDEAECKRTLSSLMAGIPSACRQLGMVVPSPCGLSTCPAAPAAAPCVCEPKRPQPDELAPQPPAVKPETEDNQPPPNVWLPPQSTFAAFDRKLAPAAAENAAPKRLANVQQQRRRNQPQFDPFSALVSLFTPREY
jgi:hypothetical protein